MRATRILIAACALAAAATVLLVAPPFSPASTSSVSPTVIDDGVTPALGVPSRNPSSAKAVPPGPQQSETRRVGKLPKGSVDEADGVLPDTATVFDDEYAGIAKLDPQLLKALRKAAKDARRDKVVFHVSSAWRSPAYQAELLRQGIATYGSAEEAAPWVAPPDKSLHVLGDAVDIDGAAAKKWLARNGAAYCLCRVYDNEPWHFELRPEAREDGCPARYRDATHDPRLR